MRVCPECGTQYEDHVPTCIADGAVLTLPAPALAEVATALTPVASRHGAGSPPASAGPSPSTNAPPSPTPTPAAARAQRNPAPARRTPTPAPITPPPPPQPSGSRTGLFVALSGLLLLAIATGGLVIVIAVVTTGMGAREETAAAPPPPPRPAPAVVVHPDPEPEPEEQPPIVVPLLSQPPGASVFENDQLVCVTPCSVAHPPHAPLPRTFVFRLDGFRDHPFEMTAAEGPIAVALVRLRSSPASQPTSATPRPSIGRDR